MIEAPIDATTFVKKIVDEKNLTTSTLKITA